MLQGFVIYKKIYSNQAAESIIRILSTLLFSSSVNSVLLIVSINCSNDSKKRNLYLKTVFAPIPSLNSRTDIVSGIQKSSCCSPDCFVW